MEETHKTFQISQTRTEFIREDKQKIIFEKTEKGWVYHAPNAQNHDVNSIRMILKKLEELNENMEIADK